MLKGKMIHARNTQIALAHGLDAEALDFVERMVNAGHEFDIQNGGPQPIVVMNAGDKPFMASEVLEWARWANREAKIRKVVCVLVSEYNHA